MKYIYRAALCAALAVSAFAQNASLMPVAKQQFWYDNASGKPLAGGFVYTCVAGSACTSLSTGGAPTNPLVSYTDSTGTTANPNPVVLDSGGFAGIWLTPGTAYKIVVENYAGVIQYTVDQVSAPAAWTGSGSFATLSASSNTTIGGTLIVTGATTLSSLLVNGNGTLTGTFSTGALGVTNNATIGGTLNVTGAATLSSAAIAGNETVGSITTGTLSAAGAATIGGTLGVTGGTTLGTLAVTSNATIGGTLTTGGAVAVPSLAVTVNETVGGSLAVAGTVSAPNLNQSTTNSVCSTGSTSYAQCSTTLGWGITFPDTNYAASCTLTGGFTGYPYLVGLTKSTTGVTVTISNGTSSGAVVSSAAGINCVAIGQ